MLALDGSYHGASIQNRCEDHRLIRRRRQELVPGLRPLDAKAELALKRRRGEFNPTRDETGRSCCPRIKLI